MAEAIDIARHILWLAQTEMEPEPVSHLRLQKLLYYVQGWSLAIRGRKMFDARIEGWVNGPVVRSLYPSFADYGYNTIPAHEGCEATDLDSDDLRLIGWVWGSYKAYSAEGLKEKTHQESPYTESRAGLSLDQNGRREIGIGSMEAFFKTEYDRVVDQRFSPARMRAIQKDFSEGRGIKASEIRRRLEHAR